MVAYLINIFKNMFLSLENDCFDERKVVQKFWESLKWFGALFEFFKNYLWSPFVHPRVSSVHPPPFAFDQTFLEKVFLHLWY